MGDFTIYWIHLVIFGFLFGLGSLIASIFTRSKESLACIGFGLLLIVFGAVGGIIAINRAPGGVDTDPEVPSVPDIPRPRIQSLIQTLKQPWDSEAKADWPVTHLMAKLSSLAYQKPVDAEDSFAELGFQKTTPIRDSSLSGYVVSVDRIAVVIFRGTENPFDWFFNLNAFTDDTPNGPIHRGFHRGYQSLKPEIRKILAKVKAERIWITGHSLGGAMALACALDLAEDKKLQLEGLVTFGQPLLASEQLAFHIDHVLLGKYARLVNEQDLVARVPATMKNCGSLVWFCDGKVYRAKQRTKSFGATGETEPPGDLQPEFTPLTQAEFEEVKRQMRETPKGARPDDMGVAGANPYFIDEHSMDNYIEKVNRHIFEFKNKSSNNIGSKR